MRGPWFLLAACVLALAAPLPARAEDDKARKYYYEDIFEPFFALDPARGLWKAQRPGALAASFPAVKEPGTFRVFVIGSSIATLLGDGSRAGDLGAALKAALPSKKIELVNCGMSGYDSYREALIEAEVLSHAPDLIVLLTGHNEMLGSPPVPVWILKTQERLSRFSAYRALVSELRSRQPPSQEELVRLARRREEAFAENLRSAIRQARQRSVPVAVVVPPINYRDSAALDGALPTEGFLPGWLAFLRGDCGRAVQAWKRPPTPEAPTLARRGEEAVTEAHIGRCQERLGLWPEARASFERAVSAYPLSPLCGPLCQGTLRDIGQAEGAVVVEADRVFRERSFPRMPGLDVMNDRMHWKSGLNCLVSGAVVDAVKKDPRFAGLPWDEGRLSRLKAACPGKATPDRARENLKVLSYALLELSAPDLDKPSLLAAFYLNALLKEEPGWFRRVPGLAARAKDVSMATVYGRELAAEKTLLPRLYWHTAEARLQDGDLPGGLEDLSQALRLEPALPWAWLSRGLVEGLQGDPAAARRSLKAARDQARGAPQTAAVLAQVNAVIAALELGAAEVSPEEEEALRRRREEALAQAAAPGHWLDEADAAAAKGLREEALAALERAAALRPDAAQWRRLARSYGLLKEPGKRLEALERAGAQAPDEAELRELARAYEALSRHEDRLRALRALRTLRPEDGGLALQEAAAALAASRREEARSALDAAVRLSTGPAQKQAAALLYQELGALDQAVAVLESLAKQWPGQAAYRKDLGVAQYLAGSPDAAVASLTEAVRLDASLLDGYLSLGMALAALGRYDEAIAAYDLAPPALRGPLAAARRDALSKRKRP